MVVGNHAKPSQIPNQSAALFQTITSTTAGPSATVGVLRAHTPAYSFVSRNCSDTRIVDVTHSFVWKSPITTFAHSEPPILTPLKPSTMAFTPPRSILVSSTPNVTHTGNQPTTYFTTLSYQPAIHFGSINPLSLGWASASHPGPAHHNNTSRLPKAKLSFPEFDEHNPTSWVIHCQNVFDQYQVTEDERMTYVAIHFRNFVDNWFRSYMAGKKGNVTWASFCEDVCLRFGNTKPMQVVLQFN